jgi:pyrimidine operon attenuation protein / uracil phosphoribosyltransferase
LTATTATFIRQSAIELDAEALYQTLLRGVRTHLAITGQPTILVGVISGGAWLAERLHADLGLSGVVGRISSVMHRDDFGRRGLAHSTQSQLPFDVHGAHILLIDDVLYTGRTIRAVLNELFDYGRPASVALAVLVDRGGRELPVEAAVAAARFHLPAHQKLALARHPESGCFHFDVEISNPTTAKP